MNKVYEKIVEAGIYILDRLTDINLTTFSKSSDMVRCLNNSIYHSPTELLIEKNSMQRDVLITLSRSRNKLMGILLGDQVE